MQARIYALKQIRKFVDIRTLVSVYNALTHPYFSYCCEVWDVFGETQSKRLQKLQNRAACVIASVPNDVAQQIVLDLLGWKTLKEQRLKTKAKTMFKILHNMGPNFLKDLFIFKNEILNFNLPKPRSNSLKKSFMYDGAFIWNSLPEISRESKTLSIFERKIATHCY
jgi:hypothetical protein